MDKQKGSDKIFCPRCNAARNHDEKKENDYIDELYEIIKDSPTAINLLISLVAHYNSKIFRLKFFLDKLSDEIPLTEDEKKDIKKTEHPKGNNKLNDFLSQVRGKEKNE